MHLGVRVVTAAFLLGAFCVLMEGWSPGAPRLPLPPASPFLFFSTPTCARQDCARRAAGSLLGLWLLLRERALACSQVLLPRPWRWPSALVPACLINREGYERDPVLSGRRCRQEGVPAIPRRDLLPRLLRAGACMARCLPQGLPLPCLLPCCAPACSPLGPARP